MISGRGATYDGAGAKLDVVLGGACRTSLRPGSERRKSHSPTERIAAALCECSVQSIADNRKSASGGEDDEKLRFVAADMERERRRALSDGEYLDALAEAEQACARR